MNAYTGVARKVTDIFSLVGEKFIGANGNIFTIGEVKRTEEGWFATATDGIFSVVEPIPDPMFVRVLA